jgi:hypothetical protein
VTDGHHIIRRAARTSYTSYVVSPEDASAVYREWIQQYTMRSSARQTFLYLSDIEIVSAATEIHLELSGEEDKAHERLNDASSTRALLCRARRSEGGGVRALPGFRHWIRGRAGS